MTQHWSGRTASGFASLALVASTLILIPTAQASDGPDLDQIGARLQMELEHIEAVGFALPQSFSILPAEDEHLDLAEPATEVLMEEETEATALREKRADDGLVLLSSNIELLDYEIVEKTEEAYKVSYEFMFTRELPDLIGDDAWQEITEYEVTLDPQAGVVEDILVKDLDYYNSSSGNEEVVIDNSLSSNESPSSEIGNFTTPARNTIDALSLSGTQRQKVADYALKWWDSKNSNYPVNYANDCTNFTSQALHAGGWQFQTGLWNSDSAWWGYNRPLPPQASYPWGGAENFYRFAVNNSKRTTIHKYVSDSRVGDILQFKNPGQTNMTHSMVVTKKSGSMIYLTYHTKNTKNKPFSEINNTAGRKWFAHKV